MENNPPYAPSNYYPCDEIEIPLVINLSWDGGDPDPDDTVYYDIYLNDIKITTVGPYPWNQTRIDYGPIELKEYHTYYMKICAYDNHGAYIEGPICSFTTGDNHPPTYPIIDGPTSGRKNKIYEYTFMSTDPEYHSIWYHVKWGDGIEDLTGLYPNGTTVTLSHSWDSYGEMQIEARAIDEHYASSGWSTWTITIPRNKQEDCDCQEVSEIDLNRLDKVIDIFGNYKELLNRFSTLEGIESDNYTICTIMYYLAFYYMDMEWYFLELSWSHYDRGHQILYLICAGIAHSYEMRYMYIGVKGQELDCWWVVE
jgi:hypothetical protein